ncbi:MAG: hypothetical protein V7646_4442 [Pseudonocardia sp.]
MTIRLLIADDQELVRTAFALLVATEPDMTVVGEAADGHAAVDLARRAHPKVVLMDVRMPGCDGIAATRQLTADPTLTDTRILILTTFDLDEYVFGAVRAGASGFLLKDTPASQLLTAIRIIAAGEALLAPSATRRLIAEYASRPQPAERPVHSLDTLTDRETEVLRLIASGLSNDEICHRLHVSMATTKTHIGRLLAKLAARDRAQLVIAAYEAGLVT